MSSGSDRRDGALIKGLLNTAWLHALQSAPPPTIRKGFLGSTATPGSHPATPKARLKPGSLTTVNHSCSASLALLWRIQPLTSPEYISHRTVHFGGHCFPRHRNSGMLLVRRWFCSALGKPGACFWTQAARGFFQWAASRIGYFQRGPSPLPPVPSSLNPYKWCFLTEKWHTDKQVLLKDTFMLSKFLIHTSHQVFGNLQIFCAYWEKKSIFSSFSFCELIW